MTLIHRTHLIAVTLLLVLAACSAPGKGITVEDAWVRASAAPSAMGEAVGMPTTAAYLRISNNSQQADRLVGAESPAARAVEIHQTSMQNDVASMQHMPSVEIPAGGSLEFKPGGYHLMLIDLVQPLAAGDEVEISLVFENAGKMTIRAVVND